jgi:hypothetical protein
MVWYCFGHDNGYIVVETETGLVVPKDACGNVLLLLLLLMMMMCMCVDECDMHAAHVMSSVVE